VGYHVTILRTQGRTAIPIGIDEIERAVAGRPEFRLTRDVRGEPVVEFADCGNPPPCVWHTDGEWWTKNPDKATIDAMCRLADLLDARVLGDELETYRSSGDRYFHSDDAPPPGKHRRKKPAMRFWVMGVCLILGILAGRCSRRKPSEALESPASSATPVLINGSFDGNSLAPWDCEEGTIVQDGDNPVLEVTLDGGVFGLRQDIQWPGGEQALTLSFRVKAGHASEESPIQLRARLFDQKGNSAIIATRSVAESSKWLEVNTSVQRPDFAPVSFMIESNRGEGSLRIDDVRLE
jgi:hypothetical protein